MAGYSPFGSSSSSTPFSSSGETTVNYLASPSGISCFLMKPNFSV
jgi:hypothetical protein